jgi:hypothetical protein
VPAWAVVSVPVSGATAVGSGGEVRLQAANRQAADATKSSVGTWKVVMDSLVMNSLVMEQAPEEGWPIERPGRRHGVVRVQPPEGNTSSRAMPNAIR